MELMLSVFRRHMYTSKSPQAYDSLHNGHSLCSVSSKNIIAYTTVTELDDLTGKSWGSHLYVSDFNTLWHGHKVLSNKSTITILEWDHPGDKLLVGDTDGNVQLWTFKDHVINDWMCIGVVSFEGENILGGTFFHNGKKIGIVPEKKDSMYYNEKFTHLRITPSIRHFGGCPIEGCLVVTTTGLIGVVICSQEGQGSTQLIKASDSLALTRNRITTVDICCEKSGQFIIAVSSGKLNLPIQCYRVTLKLVDDKCVILSHALPSFFLQSNPIKESQCHQVAQIKFVGRENADSMVVAANSETGCIVEFWELREKPLPIHKIFLPKSHGGQTEPYKTMSWQHTCNYVASYPVTCITTSKLHIAVPMAPPGNIILALTDGTIVCLSRDALKQISSFVLNISPHLDDLPAPKRQRYSVQISHMDLTWLGLVLLLIDTHGQLHVFRLYAEPGNSLMVPYACTLLEYCLVTGLDWWDALISFRPSIIETICDRFTESYNRQPTAVQQFHYIKHLNIKTSLYRMTINGQSKAADLMSTLMLHSVATAFKSLLRPSDLSSHDKGPADSLAAVMTESLTDVDKVLLHLEAKEFTVEPSTLQSLQQLIQWVADLALNLLARLPEQRQISSKGSGYDILRDYKSLNTLRELLVIIRIWGLLRQSCLPVFVRSSENLDVLALLFKLLSRLIQSTEPDETLLDDCCLLPSQVMIPQLNPPTKIVAVASPVLFYQSSWPIQLHFGLEPDCLQFIPELNPVEGAMQTEQIVDSIRHIYLGKHPLVVKQCCRCGGMALNQFQMRTTAIRAWDMRWARECLCGGRWRIHSFASN